MNVRSSPAFSVLAALCLACSVPASARGDMPAGVAREASALGNEDLALAGEAAEALGRRGESAFPAIREALASSPQQRWAATVALYRSTADIGPFLPTLTAQLSDPDEALVQASLEIGRAHV